jgi:hypothetical protein
MSKNYIVWLKRKKNLHAYNTNHGTVNTKVATMMILRVLKMPLHVTMYWASDGDLEAENAKYLQC